eukprot:UN20835
MCFNSFKIKDKYSSHRFGGSFFGPRPCPFCSFFIINSTEEFYFW